MDQRSRLLIAVAAIIGVPVVGLSVVLIGNNTGTATERCDRFWLSRAASVECHQQLADYADARDAARAAELQRQVDVTSRRVEQDEANIRATDRAMSDLQASRP